MKTYKEILNAQLGRIPDTVDKREGSIIMSALGPASWYLEGTYLDLAKLQDNIYAPTAGGAYLELIAQSHGLERKAAATAVKKGVFNVQVPEGSRFSTISTDSTPSLVYAAMEYVGPDGDRHIYRMECETAGEIGNAYVGQLLAIDHIQNLSSAVLAEFAGTGTDGGGDGPLRGRLGADEENDGSLRGRLLQKIRLPSTSGNKYDYYNWAMECTGVGAAKVFPLADGPGTVKVVIANSSMGAAGSGLVSEVYDYIEERRPIGATLSVASAREKAIGVEANVKLRNGVALGIAQNQFRMLLDEHLKANAFQATYISVARIGNLLLDVAGVEDYSDLALNGIPGNVTLQDEEIAVAGIVRLGVM